MRSNMTGVGYYNSEPRNFNRDRSIRRRSPKPFQRSEHHPSPQPPLRGGDLFMEAGRLAVEYLVSRGLLSPNVLPGKSQNGSLRNNLGESNDIRGSQDRDSSRRSVSDQDQRNYSRERRRLGPSRSYSLDRTCENEKEGSFTEEPRAMEVANDVSHKDATSQNNDTVFQISHSDELAIKGDKHIEVQDDTGKGCAVDDLDLKMTLEQKKDDEGLVKSCHATKFEDTEIGADNRDKENTIMDGLAVQQGEEKSSDTKSDPVLNGEENNVSAIGLDSLDTKNCNAMNVSEEIPSSKTFGSGVSYHSITEAEMVNPGYPVDEQKTIEPLSFMGKTFSYEGKSSGFPELGLLCSSIGKDRGEKRPIEEDSSMEGAKKAKLQWLSVAQSDDYSQLSDLSNKHSLSPVRSTINIFNVSGSQESFANVSLPLKGYVESDTSINQGEKQLLSNSFKICDLNLMEASDMHENHEVSLLYPAISGPSRDLSVDIDLSMRNNPVNEYNAPGSHRKEIEIIDLEDTSLEECKTSNTSMKNTTEAGMTTIENYSHPQNATENRDAQEGYGFMISELLGNEVPNSSSVQPDMNSLHNDLGMNHAEGMFSEDDPIYMSLGEIPLTGLLRAWEQPTQERNPFEL